MNAEEATRALDSLSKKAPRGCTVGKTAAAAPWNKTGREFWQILDRTGREVMRADTPGELTRKLEASRA